MSSSSPPVPGASTRKRRRTPDSVSGWASLHEDPVGLVAARLLAGDLLDYVRLRAVCTGWRSSTASPRGRGVADPRFHPRRWVMFPEGHSMCPGRPDVRFLNLDTGTFVRVKISLLGYHRAFESVDGLLLLLRDPDPHLDDGTVRILNPFTGDTAEFPPLGTLVRQMGIYFDDPAESYRILTSEVCASVSFTTSGAMTIMLALNFLTRIAYATSLDRQWTLSSWEYPRPYPPLSPFSFQGKLYTIDCDATPISHQKDIHQVLEIDPPVQDDQVQPPKLIATIPQHKLLFPYGLVQCGSEVLVLGHNDFYATQMLVCELTDLQQQRFAPVRDIGGNTLFLQERNISVSSKILPTVKGDNVIYARVGCPYLKQYHLSSGSLLAAIDNCSLYGLGPGPSSLVHHIFSCCFRNLWNRGEMFKRIVQPGCSQNEQDHEASPSYLVLYNNMWFPGLRLEFASSYAAHKPLFSRLIQFTQPTISFVIFFYDTLYINFELVLV